MAARPTRRPGLLAVLNSNKVRHAEHDGQTVYAVADVLAIMTDAPDATSAAEHWYALKKRLPQLETLCERVDFPGGEDNTVAQDAANLAGILRIIQSLATPRAERVKTWLAQSAVERLQEIENPELAILHARQEYERRGYRRPWIDQRLRAISARHELTSEWYKRGARESDDFRALTNEFMQSAFGLDVEGYRSFKNLTGTGNLRDAMTDLELALTTLGETTAAALHRHHDTAAIDDLKADAHQAGDIVAHTRQAIEQATGQRLPDPTGPGTVVSPRTGRRSQGGRAVREAPTGGPAPAEPQSKAKNQPRAK